MAWDTIFCLRSRRRRRRLPPSRCCVSRRSRDVDEAKLPPRELAGDDLARQVQRGFVFGVIGVEVRTTVMTLGDDYAHTAKRFLRGSVFGDPVRSGGAPVAVCGFAVKNRVQECGCCRVACAQVFGDADFLCEFAVGDAPILRRWWE